MNSKIQVETTTTTRFKTADGRSFDSSQEAEKWQATIDLAMQIGTLPQSATPMDLAEFVVKTYLPNETITGIEESKRQQRLESLRKAGYKFEVIAGAYYCYTHKDSRGVTFISPLDTSLAGVENWAWSDATKLDLGDRQNWRRVLHKVN